MIYYSMSNTQACQRRMAPETAPEALPRVRQPDSIA